MVSPSLVGFHHFTISFSPYLHTGYTDLPSRLPTQSSTLYSNNITKFLLSIGDDKRFNINLEDEVVRGSIVTRNGEILPPVVRAMPPPAPTPAPVAKQADIVAITPWQKAKREVATVTAGMGSVIALGKATGPAFMDSFFTFGLAGLVGYRVIWGVTPALHSPLMSVTNAISGLVCNSATRNSFPSLIALLGRCCRYVCHGRWISAAYYPSSFGRYGRPPGHHQRSRRVCYHQADVGYVQA